jgi:hypothetical protein
MITFSAFVIAGEKPNTVPLSQNGTKQLLIEESFLSVDSLLTEEREEKSVLRAALYSAIIPGSGQYYAGSVWKSILFAGVEVVCWTAYFVYTSKGDNQDVEMRGFADAHWSEQKYWSRLYYDATLQGVQNLPAYEVDENNILINYNADVVESLRFLEKELGHTHSLPHTKTQQYYEMIYKYATQFGNGWEDANFYATYYGNTNNLTPQMFAYRDMRNDMNNYYDVATTFTNVILVNHVLSALDAAWTARNHNRKIQMKIRSYNKRYFDENVQMFGINLYW